MTHRRKDAPSTPDWVDIEQSPGSIDLSALQGFDTFAMGTEEGGSQGCCGFTWDYGSTCRNGCCGREQVASL